MAKRAPTRLALLYHDPLLRDIVRHVLGNDGTIEIVAEWPAASTPLAQLVALAPDVVVIDRRTLGDELPAAVASLLSSLAAHHPQIRVIALSLAEAQVTLFSGQQLTDITVEQLVEYVHDTGNRRRPRRARRRGPSESLG
ncbi:MAG TPA: hypothetical protein VKZ60_01130 [Chloroflexota bacterium]|jgi:DNA-binding NarL/FixJ family response regulator|nr:hypothetical protein [Chloroflexota bacterium]